MKNDETNIMRQNIVPTAATALHAVVVGSDMPREDSESWTRFGRNLGNQNDESILSLRSKRRHIVLSLSHGGRKSTFLIEKSRFRMGLEGMRMMKMVML